MAKTLELQFVTAAGKNTSIRLDNPKEPVDLEVVKQSMAQIIAADAFISTNGNLVSAKGVKLIERNVTEYEVN